MLSRLREAAASARTSWAGVHSWGLDVAQRGYAELERAAVGLRVFQSSVIPGQLQIGPYARRVFELATDFGAEEIARAVQARLERQLIVHRPPRDGCRFVVTEAALRWRPIGDPDARTQIAQLDRLLTLLDLPGVDLRVLPWDEPQVATHRQPFVHLTLSEDDDEPAGPGLVIVEGIDGENRIHDPDRVELYRKWFERYAEHAHGGEDARTLIRRTIDSLVRG